MKLIPIYYVGCFSFFNACQAYDELFDPLSNPFEWGIQPGHLDDSSEAPARLLGLQDGDQHISHMPNRQIRRLNGLDLHTNLPLRSSEAHGESSTNTFSFSRPGGLENSAMAAHHTEVPFISYTNPPIPKHLLTGIPRLPAQTNPVSSEGIHSSQFPSLSPAATPLTPATYANQDSETVHEVLEPFRLPGSQVFHGDNYLKGSDQSSQHWMTDVFPSESPAGQDNVITQADAAITSSESPAMDSQLTAFFRNFREEMETIGNHQAHDPEFRERTRFRFTEAILRDKRTLKRYDNQVNAVIDILRKFYRGELLMSEDEFKSIYIRFHGPTVSRSQKRKSDYVGEKGNHADRAIIVQNKRLKFNENKEIWYDYWETQTNINFKRFLPYIRLGLMKELFPLFLFYVDMIRTIVPRPQDQKGLDYTKELEEATISYLNFAEFVTKNAPIDKADLLFTNLDESFNSRHSYHSTLWSFLEFWMQEHRPTLLQENYGSWDKIHPAAKIFFNNVFCSSIENLSEKFKNFKASHTLLNQ
ncbi:hypothetical protein Pst134EA_007593 [Puccinia striiformis f. sp. tritici]|uniref:hypothetical protein n=1 Tax=Puccinia striiformis f. sp. tritici TaxID=168172 RepID=UPI0020079D9D|nr:hypothetical protein Pst134EA_007593 [Puccinia striiformis f. sp. tritici]KAH9470327.1 hypothetical protein Pst134EA_007593 [Puccinia striiformis f. sp. tritici]KAI9624724.1 hypothetical protein KEM48_008727 [Puccinia striiformis f. sp. tritici PST-130]